MADKPKPQLTPRKSPLGFPEFIVPPELQGEYLQGAEGLTSGSTAYFTPYAASSPSLTEHERIHVGQNQLTVPGNQLELASSILNRLAGIAPTADSLASDSARFHPAMMRKWALSKELPAYLFSEQGWRNPELQKAFSDYINMISVATKGQAYPLEAQMPDAYNRAHLTHGPLPPPPGPTVPMRMVDLLTGKPK